MRYPVRTKTKAGFTLIELLVVIAILAILMSLVTAGVLKYMDNIPKAQTVNDLRQLAVALETFKTKYGVYPPSSIYLSNGLADYTANGQQASLNYLYAIWPRLAAGFNAGIIDWSGGQGGIPAGGIVLEGDQCLVFFLNGPGGANANGWSTNPTNPTQTGGPRAGPFFEFPLDRLLPYPHVGQTAAVSAMFPSFWDAYSAPSVGRGKPYAFFCSGRSAGGYNPAGDCPSLFGPLGATNQPAPIPYRQSSGRFHNPNTFQLISAGKDFTFGPGGVWPPTPTLGFPTAYNPGTVTAVSPLSGIGIDDLSNFSSDLLGVF
jgi:prepilin-type N-terminal cleavage/methylation domain-containing protein